MAARERLITSIDQIPAGEGRTFRVDGREIAMFHTHDGSVFATQALCPHLKGPLADGLVGGTIVMCPLHDRTFDLKTGCGTSHEKMTIETFPVRVEPDGKVFLVSDAAHAPAQ